MSRYRKVDPRVWNDEKFRLLSDSAKLVFFFLLTHPHMTALGAMRASVPGLAAELGWQVKAFREAFDEALSKGMVKHDERASFISLPNFLRYNGPESPNVVKSWSASLDLLPECTLKNELLGKVKAFAEALPEAFREALPEAFAKGMPNQEQEQEQEQKEESPQTPLSGGLVLPVWLPADIWEDFRSHRKSMKAKLTAKAEELALTKLSKLRDAGHDPRAVIEQSIERGWKGLFPINSSNDGTGDEDRVARIKRLADDMRTKGELPARGGGK